MGETSLLPSLIVLGIVVLGLAAVSTVLTRRSRNRAAARGRSGGGAAVRIGPNGSGLPEIGGGAPVKVDIADLRRQAGIQLVQMDDALRAGRDELLFAQAEFGEASTHGFADALDTAERRAAEAFALQQQLDDHIPDTEERQREWTKRILSLSDSALALVTAQSRSFGERRRRETSAPAAVARLHDDLAAARAELTRSAAVHEELAAAYDPAALTAVAGNIEAATESFDEAEALAADVDATLRTDPLASVAKRLDIAAARMRRGRTLLESLERLRADLLAATAARQEALDRTSALLAEATRLRDTVDDQGAAARIIEAAARLSSATETARARDTAGGATPGASAPALGSASATSAASEPAASTPAASTPAASAPALRHPVADLDALTAASTSLDDTLAIARTAQQRLDSAREALRGALALAESRIIQASDFIEGRRSRVGTDARTRLADARRELEHARLEADPVAALDAARRAATRATDADALARYDASGLRP
ncbi:hypothetical protein N1028_04290 [Herbiconiux sp. CPCC 203407]|uniref:Uncharacterized protein n=1 Tax=Herbiconiux oxytropis TaxID=2970915 RepID=A0AA41XG71_9MICO|nr:hypothetical protein [Herbiconiux oxytropis]MCS5724049.1 hypothetical protein [Herbiconiux oxytropis]MCS5725110.1 hypothetical protein [Herbiconiux oxytropis]